MWYDECIMNTNYKILHYVQLQVLKSPKNSRDVRSFQWDDFVLKSPDENEIKEGWLH